MILIRFMKIWNLAQKSKSFKSLRNSLDKNNENNNTLELIISIKRRCMLNI